MTARWPVRRVLPGAGLALAAVLYASWLLGPVLNPAMDTVGGYASELAARDQPYASVFRLGDVVTGVAVGLVALLLFVRSVRPSEVGGPDGTDGAGRWWGRPDGAGRWWARLGWSGAAGFGVATALDGGVTSMDCAPSIDPWCAQLERLGRLSTTHQLHTVTSSVAVTAAFASLVGLTMAVRPSRVGRLGLLLTAYLLVTSVGTMIEVAAEGDRLGVWQRAQLVGLSGWLLLAAVVAARELRDPAR